MCNSAYALTKRGFIFFLTSLFLFTSLFQPPIASGLSVEQKRYFNSQVKYFDAETCSSGGVSGSAEGGPLKGVHFPEVADKAILADAIHDYIKKGWSSSPLVEYADEFVMYGEKYDVNPLISVVIAQVEYQFGTARTDLVGPGGPGQYNYWAVTHNSNSATRFGAYTSIDEAMEEHFKLLSGKSASAQNGISYIGPPQNFTTISQIMNQYAPSFENDTDGYIQTIIDGMGKILRAGGVKAGDGETAAATAEAGGCECSTNDGGNTADLAETLKKLADENGGKTAISVQAINGDPAADANGNDQMPTRSSYKVYTAYATLKAIEDGRISWSSRVSAAGWSGTVESTMEAMIVKSNNSAAAALRLNNTIGSPAEVTKLLQDKVGLSQKTVMGSGDTTNSNSRSTANDFVTFLSKLEKRELPGVSKDDSYEKLLSYMKRATTDGGSARDGIVAGVKGVVVADKPGWASGSVDPASNDVGIVYLPDKPYALAILTDTPNQWDGVAKIASEINAAMGGLAGDCAGTTSGDLEGTIKAYAWPNYSSSRSDPKPEYKKALDAAGSKGQYTGGGYTDCGAFVTRAMIDSGYEPKYNSSGKGGNTTYQMDWLRSNWKKINMTSTKDLQLGDVAISSSHTYMYVGNIDGFNGNSASASLGSRVPMASDQYGGFEWYRKE